MENKVMEKHKLQIAFILTGLLSACGGGGGGDDSGAQDATGMLLVSESSAVTAQRVMGRSPVLSAKVEGCPEVPDGYFPLQSVSVEFLIDAETVATTTTTDECGGFSASIPDTVTQVRARSADNRDLVTNVEVFTAPGGGIASTFSVDAELQIASLQSIDSSLVFTVTDTLTNKAVIGIPGSAFSMTVNSADVGIVSVQNASNTSEPASVTLVMDASGSMDSEVFDNQTNDPILDSNGFPYNRMRIAALAAHTYLDNMPSTDETAFVIFDGTVNFIDDAAIANLFSLVDGDAGAIVNYTFSASGFTNNSSGLRFVVDAYNVFSSFYSDSSLDESHPESPDIYVTRNPWGGSTAMYDAISEALDRTNTRASLRKLVIAMSDGEDNSSSNSEEDVIASANSSGIPVYTIAYGDADPDTMENIALGTNATSFIVADADLTGVFQSIQTGITFQYIANMDVPFVEGDLISLTMDYNGLQVSRDITH
jgi:hypothetical protein